jgi:hypothetical protein
MKPVTVLIPLDFRQCTVHLHIIISPSYINSINGELSSQKSTAPPSEYYHSSSTPEPSVANDESQPQCSKDPEHLNVCFTLSKDGNPSLIWNKLIKYCSLYNQITKYRSLMSAVKYFNF